MRIQPQSIRYASVGILPIKFSNTLSHNFHPIIICLSDKCKSLFEIICSIHVIYLLLRLKGFDFSHPLPAKRRVPETINMKITQRNTSLLILFNYFAMVMIWGSFPVAAKIGVEHAPPLLLSGVRFSIAFAIMAPLALIQRKKLLITRQQHLQVFLISLLMVAIPSSIFFISTLYA